MPNKYYVIESQQKGSDMKLEYAQQIDNDYVFKTIEFNSSELPEALIQKLLDVEHEIIEHLLNK